MSSCKEEGSVDMRCAPCDGFRKRGQLAKASRAQTIYAMARRPASVARQAPSHSMPPAVSSASMKYCG